MVGVHGVLHCGPALGSSVWWVVEAEGGERMQFYEVGVRIVARFGGLRWVCLLCLAGFGLGGWKGSYC